jgi:aspartyl/asparaginyl-tRNA synthetase
MSLASFSRRILSATTPTTTLTHLTKTPIHATFSTSTSSFSRYLHPYESPLTINTEDFSRVTNKLRAFFLERGFLEAHTQNRLSILAACEDPFTVSTFHYAGHCWPLPQTGQMWLEYELLKAPSAPGFFCVSTSYRNEPNPIEGRHLLSFPMFEFEMHGNIEDMIAMEKDLLSYLGYHSTTYKQGHYKAVAEEFNVHELDNDHEMQLCKDIPVFFLTDFPEYTHPFWNMKRHSINSTANKVDIILSGHETIGSAERETDINEMRRRFDTIMDGAYRDKLFSLFGEKRTLDELDAFLSFNFFERSGGGIGITRLIHSMKKEKLLV